MKTKHNSAFSLIELSIVIIIIGILIAGVTAGSRVVQNSKEQSARTLTQSSDVASIKDLVAWFDVTDPDNIAVGTLASNAYGAPEDESRVARWKDRNPQMTNKIVSAMADENRPVYVQDGINGIPSIEFGNSSYDSGKHAFQTTTDIPLNAGDSSYTYAVVFRPRINGSLLTVQGDALSPTGSASTILLEINKIGFATHGADYFQVGYTVEENYIAIIAVDLEESSGSVSIYRNSNTPTSGNPTNKSQIDLKATRFLIGSRYSGGTEREYEGLISEVIIFDRKLKSAEIKSVNSYLSQKYNIALN